MLILNKSYSVYFFEKFSCSLFGLRRGAFIIRYEILEVVVKLRIMSSDKSWVIFLLLRQKKVCTNVQNVHQQYPRIESKYTKLLSLKREQIHSNKLHEKLLMIFDVFESSEFSTIGSREFPLPILSLRDLRYELVGS